MLCVCLLYTMISAIMDLPVMSTTISPSRFAPLNSSKLLHSQSHTMRCKLTQTRLHSVAINASASTSMLQVKKRRSANYHPSIWDSKLIESIATPYSHECHGTRLEHLKQQTRRLLVSTEDPCFRLKLIDAMQRLGVAYHFKEDIEDTINNESESDVISSDLHSTSLYFRLLRQHGYSVSSDVFNKYRNREGKFMDSLSKDAAGLLSLYEASHLGVDGENILEEAKILSTKHIKSILWKLEGDILGDQAKQSLETPLHWRMPRVEARNFIDIYKKDNTRSSVLLELAMLDYNLVQSLYQREIKTLERWWRDLGFKKKLNFTRDRLVENYLWALGIISEPEFSKCRIGLTKFVCILTAIDDIYEVYGSLDELELFTDAVKRWDTKAIDGIPEYMKICYLAMINFANEMAYEALKDHNFNILPYLAEEWANLCGSYLVEARWFSSNHTPSFDEYMENAWISVGGPAAMVHAYMLLGFTMTGSSLNRFKNGSELIYWSSLITRLSDDLGTSANESKRGDVTKSVECYMIQKGVTEEKAKDHMEGLISYSWKKLNEEGSNYLLPRCFITMCLNMARTAQFIYQYGDGIGTSTGVTKDLLMSLIVEPISMEQLD